MKLRRALALSALLLLLGGCAGGNTERYAAPELLEPKGVTPDTVSVTRGTIWRTTVLEGVVLPGVRELSFGSSGKIGEVYVCAGSHVKAGDVLASLDVSYYESALKAQRELLEFREETQRITLREQEIRIELEELTLEDLRTGGASDSSIRLQELAVEKLRNTKRESDELWALDRASILETIAALEGQIAAGYLTAPCDGTVVSCLASDGGYAMENVGVLRLAEDAALYLSVDTVNLTELRAASEVYATAGGERIEVAYRTETDRTYSPRTTSSGDATSAFDITDTNGNPVEVGMSAIVFILSDRTEDALLVPTSAVRFDGAYYVYQIVDGNQVRRSVKCGVANDGETQILDGLQEGDVVYAGT